MNEVQKNFRREMGMERPEDKATTKMIDLDELMLQRDMTDSQRLLFQSELNKVRKNRTTALLLTLLLGGVGAHRYYMGQIGLGVIYTLFSWTFIPGIIALVELFLIQKRVDRYNELMSHDIAIKVRALTR